jgi:hypothetical protein
VAKLCVEDRISIDIRQWHQRGLMILGRMICWHWQRAGREIKEIFFLSIEMDSNRVVLRSKYPPLGEEFEYIEQPIGISYTKPNYGGERAWFLCPAVSCGRKVAILYKLRRYFVCRTCCGFAYRSQRINRSRRPSKRVRKKRWIFLKSFDGHYEYVEVLQKPREQLKSGRKSDLPPSREPEVDISMGPPTLPSRGPSAPREPKPQPAYSPPVEPMQPAASSSPEKFMQTPTGSGINLRAIVEAQMRWNLPRCAWCHEPLGISRIEALGNEYHEKCFKKTGYG